MNFSQALEAMRERNARVQRSGWNGKGMWIRIVGVRDGDKSVIPTYPQRSYIEMKDAQGWVVPWLASQTDLLATDWAEYGSESNQI